MLNNLEEPSLVVMDNASYYSTLIDNFPKSITRRSDMQEWLKKKNFNISLLENLAELRMRVQALIPFQKKYEFDELEMGHEVIQLPPYYCLMGPGKNQVARNNKTYKMVDIEQLTNEASSVESD